MSYIALRGRWCSSIVLNVQAASEENKVLIQKTVSVRNWSRYSVTFLRTIRKFC